MEIPILILIGIVGIIALWLIFRLIGGCLLRIFLFLAVLALIAFLVYSRVRG